MIEQALAIATSTGGTSQATIQIPSNSLSVDNEFISKQASSGAVNISVEQVSLGGEWIEQELSFLGHRGL